MANIPTSPSTASGGLIYPPDLITADRSIVMQFQFGQYLRPSLFSLPKVAIGGQPIILPMPDKINDHPVVVWQEHSFLSDAAQITGSAAEIGKRLGIPAAGALGGVVNSGLLGTAVTGLGYMGGWVVNPMLTMLFKQPTFKEFNFSWTFAPETEQESMILNQILQIFRVNMLPDTGMGGAVLTYPNILYMQFTPNTYLFNFKPCGVKDAHFDYTPAGPAFFKRTGAPALVRLNIHVVELEYWTRSDSGL